MFKIYVYCIIIVMVIFMQQFVDSIVNVIISFIQQFGIPFGCFMVMLEAVIPILPLGVFIAFNMMAFGNLVGFIISWLSSIVGCIIAYTFFKKFISKSLEKKIEKHPKLISFKKAIKNISFSNLVLIVALPFSPAFVINAACGLVKMDFKKFIAAIIIGKISIIYFWGFVSKSLLQSVTDIKTILIVIALLLASYILSKLINRRLKIE